MKLILASASRSRRDMLIDAGMDCEIVPASIDEDEVKRSLKAERASAGEAAQSLADLKASRISRLHPEAMVIGADQVLECNGVWYDKPDSSTQARRHLQSLRGRRHRLRTAVAVARSGNIVFRHLEAPALTMRDFSDEFLDWYIEVAGDRIMESVGCYQLEREGVQLFAAISGDYFSILGLPLLPLLEFLRPHGLVKR